MKSRLAGAMVSFFVFILGMISLLAPFIFPWARNPEAQSSSFPIMVSLIIVLCLLVILFETQSSILDSKMIAFLGVLIAINSGLRFLENAIPGPAGFSPTFFLIILIGYFFGSRVGFLYGALTMLVSGLLTGGIGPWLPGQMITAGWVGQSAGFIRWLTKKLRLKNKTIEIIFLALFGASWGMLYGLVMNLWFWPFLAAFPGQIFSQSLNLIENIQRYGAYYISTSLAWDLTRAVGNILMISILAKPVLKIFERFSRRFSFTRIKVDQV
jgi:energy-coupling factor transport system substrate-specific component